MMPYQTSSKPRNTDKDRNKDFASNAERKDLPGNAHNMINHTSNAPPDVFPSRDNPKEK